MSDENIKILSSIPSLEDKIEKKVKTHDTIYWYIKFNNILDKTSINKDSMNVTDTQGYIMKTYIAYDKERNLIIISPIDSYKENKYYLLNISENIKSEKGNALKSPIHILFKLIGSEVSEFEILKSTVKVPEPRPRPYDYDNLILDTKVESLYKEVPINKIIEENKKEEAPEFPTKKIKLNLIGVIVGVILVVASIPFNNFIVSLLALNVAVLGIGHLILQISKKSFRSDVFYNMGAHNFKKQNYDKAYIQFKKAYSIDETNELAEFASKKSKYYL